MLDACNSSGYTGSNELGSTLNDMLEAIGYFKNSNHEAGDSVTAVELSADGQTLVIGSPGERSAATGIDGDQADNSALEAGAAYVYRRINGVWAQQAYLKASNAGVFDNFGIRAALAADGRTLAVAASGESSSSSGVNGDQDDNLSSGAGAVYVFVQDDAGTWSQQAYVKASDPAFDDAFGFAIDLSADGDTLAVGAPLEENLIDEIGENSGAVYVFNRDSADTWSQRAYIKASNKEDGDGFGFSVALDGNGEILAVGAPFEDSAATGIDGDQDDNTASGAGAAYVYGRSGATWEFQTYLKAPNPDDVDVFGASVALSRDGTTLAVAAHNEDGGSSGVGGDPTDNNVSDAGAAYLFRREDSAASWSLHAYVKATNPDVGDRFGFTLALSADGSTLAALSPSEASAATGIDGDQSDNSAFGAGAVYLY